MARPVHASEKRQFGRRNVLWHGWVKVAGRDREPCIVRNFSVSGALLEFLCSPPVATRFNLHIDVYGFTADCAVRHRSATAIGVYFVEPEDGIYPPGRPSAQQIIDMMRSERA